MKLFFVMLRMEQMASKLLVTTQRPEIRFNGERRLNTTPKFITC